MKQLSIYFFALILIACDGESASQQNTQSETNKTAPEEKFVVGEESRVNQVQDSLLEPLNKQIREDISNASLYLKRHAIYSQFGDFKAAKEDLERAYTIDSTRLSTLVAYGEYHMKQGELKQSLGYYELARKFHPEESAVYLKLGELYLIGKSTRLSLQNADLAIKYDQFNAQAYYLKGFNFLELKDTAKAISSFQTTVEQNPEHFEAYMQLGLLFSTKDDPLALNYFNNALDVRPFDREAMYGKGMYQQEHEMYNEALQTYSEAIEKHPNFREAHYNMGYVHMYYLKLYRQAANHFTDAIQIDPNYFQAYYNRGYSFELMGDVNNALKDYQRSLQIQPDYDLAAQGINRVNKGI